jgi:hypothetical protein
MGVMLDIVSAPSPFLPNTNLQYAWDSTSIGYFKICPRLYKYKMIDGWSQPEDSVHLRFGIEIHLAFQGYEIHRANGMSHADAMREVVKAAYISTFDWRPSATNKRMEKAIHYKNRESLIRTIVWYLEHYRVDVATTYIREDGRPAVELSFQYELETGPNDNQPYVLCGHLDRVVDYNGGLFVMDYKTTQQSISDYWFQQFSPNNQMSLYTIAGKIVLNTMIKGVIIEGIQLLVAESKFVRGITHRTEDQMSEWLQDLDNFFAQAELYAQDDYWPMNDTSCDKFGGCAFREICGKSPGVREKWLEKDFTKLEDGERWNPLKPR